MRYYFWSFKNQESIYASKSFLAEIKRFLSPLFEQSIYKNFDKKTLVVQQAEIPVIVDDLETIMQLALDMQLEPIGHLFTFKLSYRNTKGGVVYPSDSVEKNSLEFSVDGFPTSEQLIEIEDSWSEVVTFFKRNQLVNQVFRFPIKQKPSCLPPDVSLCIKTSVEGKVLEDILGEAMVKWNERRIGPTIKGSRFIHDLWFDKAVRDEKIICIDLGSSSQEGLLYLLEKLEQSDLEISRIVLK